jgi:hypothetical protein
MKRRLPLMIILALGAVGIACSGPAASGGATDFSGPPYATMASESGALQIAVRTSPAPPSRGTNDVELTITNIADGAARDDLTVAVSTWMPAMNHGAQTVPTVTAEGGGRYLVQTIDCFMPGRWELRTTLTGSTTDHATPALDIP